MMVTPLQDYKFLNKGVVEGVFIGEEGLIRVLISFLTSACMKKNFKQLT